MPNNSCDNKNPAAKAVFAPAVIAFGDSNTYGYDPAEFSGGRYSPLHRWPDILAENTGLRIINEGQNGREIPHFDFQINNAIGRIESHALHCRQTLLMIMLGTNDLTMGCAAFEAAERMDDFLSELKLRIPVPDALRGIILIQPPVMKRGFWVNSDELCEESARLGPELRKLALKHGTDYIPTSKMDPETAISFDGVHLSEEGHHMLADILLRYFTEAL